MYSTLPEFSLAHLARGFSRGAGGILRLRLCHQHVDHQSSPVMVGKGGAEKGTKGARWYKTLRGKLGVLVSDL